jgi:hypothetical protein
MCAEENQKQPQSEVEAMSRVFKISGAVLTLALCLVALGASAASADFGLKEADLTFIDAGGSPAMQAGSHPFLAQTTLAMNTAFNETLGDQVPEEDAKDLIVHFPPGFVGRPTAVPYCATVDFYNEKCPLVTQLGAIDVIAGGSEAPPASSGVYNLDPPPGVPAKIGFKALTVPITAEVGISPDPPYNVVAKLIYVSEVIPFYSSDLRVWGTPAEDAHDSERSNCGSNCSVNTAEVPFITLPRSCGGPLKTVFEADSWQDPGDWVSKVAETHDDSEPPQPLGTTGCSNLNYAPKLSSQATTDRAESPSGLEVSVDVKDEGLTNPAGIAQSDTKEATVTLPKGVTINPSVGEGLAVCTPVQLAKESPSSAPGVGCPNPSKLGTLEIDSPLVDEPIEGSVFLAQQDDPATSAPGAENPFDTLIALYFVIKNPNLGVILKLPVKVEPDPQTGQLVASLKDLPQLPFSHFDVKLKTGARSALVTPASCGTYTTEALFTPWANPSDPLTTTASFEIKGGIGGAPCPPGGVPPFKPGFEAGATNNNAGSFSPFTMRLLRSDGEQDMTKFSAQLPPGQVGSLVGVEKCADAAVAIARSKTGRQELASPSCPQSSLIGHTLAGAGVGEALTYVGGQLYLAGPYKGDPLSVISITPAVAGPFDAGTVAIRLALTLNPKTAEVEVDGANSDPIPHILKGIVLKVRDLRVFVDRPNFTLNPTSCEESSTRATLFGSYIDIFSPADDVPAELSARYQAANCANLGFKPKLNFKLKGGTTRGGHPSLLATYKPRKGDANLEGLVVRLPRSAFLDQAHIRTICTRVQFAADNCPKAAQYGYIKAFTPLLEEPLQGPVWLRSSDHNLPDLVFDLHGLVDVEVSTRIDSKNGGIRASIESAPDAPLSKVILQMQGAKKGLIINSRNLCGKASKANVEFGGHNGKASKANPVMGADCGKAHKGKRKAKGN